MNSLLTEFVRLRPEEDLYQYLKRNHISLENFAVTRLDDGTALLTFLDIEDEDGFQNIISMTPEREDFLLRQHRLHEILHKIGERKKLGVSPYDFRKRGQA